MTSGQFSSCDEDNGSPFDCHQNVDNLFSQLTRQGQSDWKQWMQSMPEPCRLTYLSGSPSTLNYFSVNHSPAVYYDEVVGDYANPSDYCKQRVIPAGTLDPGDWSVLERALDGGSVSGFNLIIPNNCENGHNVCIEDKNGGFSRQKSVGQWDDYLSRAVPRIMNSPAFRENGLLIITFDEGYGSKQDSGGRIMFAVLGPRIKPGIYGEKATGNTQNPNLYSLLQMLEDGYILPRLGAAGEAVPLPNFWK
jgi:phosphatidylinositol-3-phosphatase